MRPEGGGHGRGDRIGFVRMQVSKVVGLNDGDPFCEFVVLNELDGDRHLVIQIGRAEALPWRPAWAT